MKRRQKSVKSYVVHSASRMKRVKKASQSKTLRKYYWKNSPLKLYMVEKSRWTMLVKIQTFRGDKHCILSVQVNSSTFLITCLAGYLTFHQDWQSTMLNDGELRNKESIWRKEQNKSPIVAWMTADGEKKRRDWPPETISRWESGAVCTTVGKICPFDFSVNCI